ncbi:MAG TPA: hypothetical protein VKU19_37755 [Bryobacteraceae bacterium]|nr:hypothetical protein [Bryobacteraceae bacterium]
MRTAPVLLLLLAWSELHGAGAGPQDAGKILEQYVKAAGGAVALAKVQSLLIEGTVAGADGRSGTYTFDVKAPNQYYTELVMGGAASIEAYNGKSAWRQDATGQISTLLGAAGMQLEAAAQYYNSRLVDVKKSKMGAVLIGHAQVRGKDALQVEVTGSSGVKRQVFFDPESHLIVKESPAGGADEALYADYRTAGGIQVPYQIEWKRGSVNYSITVSKVAVNEPIAGHVFDFPKQSQVALPDLKALFKEIEQNQKVIDKIKENYAGTRTEEQTQIEANGTLKKREVKEYSFFYLNGEEVSTLVKKDGKPLGPSEQQKEQDRVRKRVEELQKKQAKKEKVEAEGKEKDDDNISIDTVMRACRFVNPRRERFRGQDVLVFDFEPNPDFKPHKMIEKVVQKLAGVVWVDEKAHDVARMEAWFVGDLKVGGFLANVQKGSGVVIEQAFVNNEVWLPTYEEDHVGARLLFKGIREHDVTHYSDYRKFNVETISTIGNPK